jgi:hypothetical protein
VDPAPGELALRMASQKAKGMISYLFVARKKKTNSLDRELSTSRSRSRSRTPKRSPSPPRARQRRSPSPKVSAHPRDPDAPRVQDVDPARRKERERQLALRMAWPKSNLVLRTRSSPCKFLSFCSSSPVEIAVGFMREVGAYLAENSPRANNGVYERFRAVLHEGTIDKRVQYMIEVLFQVRRTSTRTTSSSRKVWTWWRRTTKSHTRYRWTMNRKFKGVSVSLNVFAQMTAFSRILDRHLQV